MSTDREKHLDMGWDLLEQGESAGALRAARALLEEQPDDPEALYLAGCAHLECDELAEAESLLRAVLKGSPGAGPARVTLAMLLHQTCRFDEAEELAAAAALENPDDADAWQIRGLALEMLGRGQEAASCFSRAAGLDPQRFAEPEEMPQDAFDAAVREALSELPEQFRLRLDDLPIITRDLPTAEILAELEDPAPDLLGLFVGTPLTLKSHADVTRAPDAIYLFRKNLQRACAAGGDLREEIRITLLHEIGHYLGMSEEDLEEAGYE